MNLGGNAVKFTDQGWVRLKAELMAEDRRRLQVRFEVADTGEGIALADQARLFHAFEQAAADYLLKPVPMQHLVQKAVDLISKRVGAPVAARCYDDRTPERPREVIPQVPVRDRGAGRPTKKDRREMEKFLGDMAKPQSRNRRD